MSLPYESYSTYRMYVGRPIARGSASIVLTSRGNPRDGPSAGTTKRMPHSSKFVPTGSVDGSLMTSRLSSNSCCTGIATREASPSGYSPAPALHQLSWHPMPESPHAVCNPCLFRPQGPNYFPVPLHLPQTQALGGIDRHPQTTGNSLQRLRATCHHADADYMKLTDHPPSSVLINTDHRPGSHARQLVRAVGRRYHRIYARCP